MGSWSRRWAPAWALAVLLCVQRAGTQGRSQQQHWVAQKHMGFAQSVAFAPPTVAAPILSPLNPAHHGRVCSAWGDFHYKTFDGDVFRFPGRCNYVFSAHCGAAYEDFNVQLRRGLDGAQPTITHVVLKTQGLVLEASNGSVLVNGRREELPYSRAGILVEQSSAYVRVDIRLVLTFMWNGKDFALLELNPKYANQTCGLCGDFNGQPAVRELYAHNTRLTPLQFGNLQKLDGPTEQCPDVLPLPPENCTDREGVCRRTLLGPAFSLCHALVDPEVYVAACTQDLCRCPECPCATFAEYSRQCAHAGGQPQSWRSPDLCPQTCPPGMQHQECGSPCADTCSNPERSQLCEDHCVDGCFCPPGTVLDDVGHAGCVPLERCPCSHRGRTYTAAESFTANCRSCTCSGGRWQCQDLPCPGTCSVQGGSHVSTFDGKLYDVHGDCSYVLAKAAICLRRGSRAKASVGFVDQNCAEKGLEAFSVLAELRRCGLTDSETCLRAVTLSLRGGDTAIRIQANGGVFLNSIYTHLPVSAANMTIFQPTSFFVLVQTGLGLQLQVQLVPLMQVYIRLEPVHRGQTCGLCGNFNQNRADDFRTLSGVVEGTAAAFANSWKTQATCPDVRNGFEDPCALSVENENYAQHWCSLLTDPTGAFSACHSLLSPTPFHANCMFDTCNCEKSEDCMCAALSSYVRACAALGVLLDGWRDGVCTKYTSSCPKSQSYAYVVDRCQPTCRALSQADVTCGVAFVPVDGCTCPSGTFLDEKGICVPPEACPCYFRGSTVAAGEVVHDNGVVCSCASGKLNCLGAAEQKSVGCQPPMVYLNCSNASAGTHGAECLRSCHTLDVGCFSTDCVSGCVCPPGLVSDGSGGCVAPEDCPCWHNEASYRPGETIRVDCNTCKCKNRKWECSHQPCLGTCVAYGGGHVITFDGQRYSFEGSCEYTLAQDHCGGSGASNGTFRIVTENVPCGTTGVTCSKAIKIFLGSYELILHEGTHKVVQRGPGGDLPYRVRFMGIYLVVETRSGLLVAWDRKTSVFIRLEQDYKGRVCGLCGNFDDNAANDFTTRSLSVVGDALEFGNSWKFSPSCPDAPAPQDACSVHPNRRSWAQKQCSVIHGPAFAACRAHVEPAGYYEACVSDACACDLGGDCECFCTAVAAYAQACHDVGVCVAWRTPDICPLFCDYYNPQGECEWHYRPCGAPCMRTCRNPSGHCLMDLPGLEGCYPECPASKPLFSEDQMQCVAQCGCYSEDGDYYEVGARVPTAENCQRCACTARGLQCTHSLEACRCTYEGRTYGYQDIVYNTTDGLGGCLVAVCGDNGTIHRTAVDCPRLPPTTPFTFTTGTAPPPSAGSAPVPTTVCVRELCSWSDWYDSGRPQPGAGGGDVETLARLRELGFRVCPAPAGLECRAQLLPDTPLGALGQKVECDPALGLTCRNSEQDPPLCHNYEVRVLCCELAPCAATPTPHSPSPPTPGGTTTTPGATPATSTPTPSMSSKAISTLGTASPTAPGTTPCQPRCHWTEWFDEDYPKSEEAGGDMETYEKIRGAGHVLCEQPWDIQCQAENFPGQTPAELGQHVHCDPKVGLICRNEEQPGLFKMCLNYRIRVLCCSAEHCKQPTATAPTASPFTRGASSAVTTSTVSPSTPLTTVPGTWPETTQGTTGLTSREQTPSIVTVGMSTTPLGTAQQKSSTGSTESRPPTSHTETSTWRAESTPGTETTTAATAGTTSVATTRSTVVASTAATTGPTSVATTKATAEATTGTTSAATTEATTGQSSTNCQPKCEWTEWFDTDFPSSGVKGGDVETYENIRAAGGRICATPQKIECRAESYPEVSVDQIGQVLTCSLQTGLVCRNKDQQGPFSMCFNYNVRVLCCDDVRHCPSSPATRPTPRPTPSPGTPTAASPTGPTIHTSLAPRTRATTRTLPPSLATTTASTAMPTRSSGSLATSPPGPIQTSAQPTSGPTSVSVTPTGTSTACQPRCTWSDWLDSSFPQPGDSGGDFETYDNIRTAGGAVCERPVELECRAESRPGEPLHRLGQVVQCRLEEGLVCRNRDQAGSFKMCLNYQVRVLCCDDSHCPGTPAATWPTASTTRGPLPGSKTPGQAHPSTPGTTQRVTTPGTGPSSPGTTQTVTTPSTGPSSAWTTQRVTTTTPGTGPSSPVTTQRVTTPGTGPSSAGTTQRVTTTNPGTGPSSPVTTQRVTTPGTGPSSAGTTQRVTTTNPGTGPSSPVTTQRVTTPGTRPSSPGTTQKVTTPSTGPSSAWTTQRVTTTTPGTGPSSPVTTQRVTTPGTGPSSAGTTQRVTTTNPGTGPSSPVTTQRVTTPGTRPSSPGTTQKVTTTSTGPSSAWTTQRVTTTTPETGPSSPVTAQRIKTPGTGPSSPVTTQRVTTPGTGPSSAGTTQRVTTTTPGTRTSTPVTTQRVTTPGTGPSSPRTTQTVTTPSTGPSSPGTTQTVTTPGTGPSVTTPGTGPSSAGTTQRVTTTTPGTGPSSPGTTQTVTTTTPGTGPSSPGTTQTVTTPGTGPSSAGTTQRVTTTTPGTGPSSPVTTQTVTNPGTGPSSAGTTQRVTTTTPGTGPSSPGTTQTVTTPGTGPSSAGTTQRVTTTTPGTGPSSPVTTQTVTTPGTGPSSAGTTQRVTTTTPGTGPSSPGTTQTVTTPGTGPSSAGTTQRVTTTTPGTGPYSPVTAERIKTPSTGPSSPVTTQRVTTTTPGTGPASAGTTQTVTTTTPGTGPSSPGTTQTVTTTTPGTGPSSPGTTQTVTTTTPGTGPSSPGTTQRVTTTTPGTGPSSPGTTQTVTAPGTGPSSPGTTQRVTTTTPGTGPSSPGTTQRVTTTTPGTRPSSAGTTQRVTTTTPGTGPSSPVTTQTVTTPGTGPSSAGTTQRVTTTTPGTGPSSPGTTQTVTTPGTGPSSAGTTQRVTTTTPGTGPSSPGTTQTVTTTTPGTGPSSPGTTQRVTTTTPGTGSSSPGTTQTVTTPGTGPSSAGTTQRVTTTTPGTGPSSPVTTQRVTTPSTGPSSAGTTQRVTTTTPGTGPSSPVTTQTVTTPGTGPSSAGTTQRVTTTNPGTGPSSPVTTQTVTTPGTGPSSAGTTQRVTTTTPGTGPSSPVTTQTVTTPGTGPSSAGTTQRVTTTTPGTGPSSPVTTQTVTTPGTGPSSAGTTQRVTTTTPGTGPSSPGTTQTVTTPGTGPSSVGTTQRVTTTTPGTGPSSPVTTQTVTTPGTGPSSAGTTQRVTTTTPGTGPSSPGNTQRVTTTTPGTGSSSPGTTQTVTTPGTGPSSAGTTQRVTTTTPGTGPSSPVTTQRVTTPSTGPSSAGTTQRVTTTTPGTGPSSPVTTQTVTTPGTGPSSAGTTQRVTTTNPGTGPSSPVTTQTVTTPGTGPSSAGTTQRVTTTTPGTGPSSPVTTQTVTTPGTGPSSAGTTQRVTTTTPGTGPSSPVTTQTVTTPGTGPSSAGTTQRVTTTTPGTGPSSPGTTQTVTTPGTGPSSVGTTQRVTTTTPGTGPSSPVTTQTVTTPGTGPSSAGTTQRVTTTTPGTGPSSPVTAQRIKTPSTGPSSPGTTQTVTTPGTGPSSPVTAQRIKSPSTGPSSPVTTQRVTTTTPGTGPSSPVTAQRIKSPSTGPSSPGTTQTVTTPGTGPSSPKTTQTITTPGTGPSSTVTTQRVTTTNPGTGPSTRVTTQRVTTPGTGPSSPGTTQRVTTPTAGTGTSSPGPTRRVTVPHSSASPETPGTTHTLGTSLAPSSTTPVSGMAMAATPTRGVCEPRCTWTDWFDEDYPTPDPDDGDFETLAVIRAAGHHVCTHPQAIECRSEQAPDAALAALGQVVVCNASLGLVCRNREQQGPQHFCHNYRVRLLCCEVAPACTSPAPTVPTATPTPPWGSLATSRTLPPSPATPCFCQAFGSLFSPGDIVYNRTDAAGCRFYAVCNQHCELDRFPGACPTVSPPTRQPTTPVSGCDLLIPPRQVNETWTLENCTVARCEGHNHITLLEPEPVDSIICASGQLPIKMWPEDKPCAYHYECECICRGWGGSNYSTFDGTAYSYSDNCTSILLREISPRYGNLMVLLDNHYCKAATHATHCPRAIIIHFASQEVILTTTGSRQDQGLILFNGVRVSQDFSKAGVKVSQREAAAMALDIMAAGVSISFNGHTFQIQLSYSRFSYNTEGQCGTCTNNQGDDCRQQDGTMASSCRDMAATWLVPDSSREGCEVRPSPSPRSTFPVPTTSPCPAPPVCELLLSQLFAECHPLVPPGPFFNACVKESCGVARPTHPCQSLEVYAALCRAQGVCSDWRNATHGLCDLTCPPGKVYKPCGPAQPRTCDSRAPAPESTAQVEGCFCPDGQLLLDTHTGLCVPQCPCVGPDGLPRLPGERWVSDCQDCVCEPHSMAVQCQPVRCEAPGPPPKCAQPGFVPATGPLATCCPETLCVCNTSTCPQSPPECGPGEELVRTRDDDQCCPAFTCRPKLCEYNGFVYGVGTTFPADVPCHTCTCLAMGTRAPVVQCTKDACVSTCRPGFEHTAVPGECCEQCLQKACITPDGQLVQPGQTWVNSLADNCTVYRCVAEGGLYVLTPGPASCPDVSVCRGTLRKSGCCYSCEPEETCQAQASMTVLRVGDCTSQTAVNMPFCEGPCPGMSKYSPEARVMQRQCTCCQETRVHAAVATLHCPNGTTVQHSYTHVDECSCTPSCLPAAPEDGTPFLTR